MRSSEVPHLTKECYPYLIEVEDSVFEFSVDDTQFGELSGVPVGAALLRTLQMGHLALQRSQLTLLTVRQARSSD